MLNYMVDMLKRTFLVILMFLCFVSLANADEKKKEKELDQVERYILRLESESPKVRAKTAKGLGRLNDPRAVEPLIELLKDEEVEVRVNAAWSLGKIGDQKAAEPLISSLNDPSSE
ncbi:MAG: HEAT repeat domain-containing protein, partial [Thermodesulfovibrionales bacterium]